MRFAILGTVFLVAVFFLLQTRWSDTKPVRSLYDVDWEEVAWCVYERADDEVLYDPDKFGPVLRFCAVVGDGTYVHP